MKISGIFEVVPGSLYSVQFAGEEAHEFSKIFRLWRDVTYLQSLFETHYEDLLAYWEYMSVDEAIKITQIEAVRLDRTILEFAHAGKSGSTENLSEIFKPLHSAAWWLDDFEKSKARGFRRKSWLRVYAVRLGVNHFVITGGAIKLTRTMNEREHLNDELTKLEVACRFLKEDQRDEFGLFELL